jgi:hypothetical protein
MCIWISDWGYAWLEYFEMIVYFVLSMGLNQVECDLI